MSDKERIEFLEKAFSNLIFSILHLSKRDSIETVLFLFFNDFMESCENCSLIADRESISVMMESPSDEGKQLMKLISETVISHAKQKDVELRFTGGIATIEGFYCPEPKQC